MNRRRFFGFVTVVLVTVGVTGVLGEVALRLLARASTGGASELHFIEFDSRLGWRSTPNYEVRYERKTSDGVAHPVSYSSTTGGFRSYGKVNASRRKLLVIGDSFTQAVNVSTSSTYAALLGKALDMEVFSYGTGGYGTLQELLVLQDVVDSIKPDVVVLQFCSNDFINNSYELESRSTINNNRIMRPYLELDGQIAYRTPFEHAWFTRLSRASRLFTAVGTKVLQMRKKSVETIIAHNPQDSGMVKSISATKTIIQRFRDRLPANARLYVFTADDARTKFRAFPDVEEVAQFSGVAERSLVDMLAALNVTYIPGPAAAVADAETRGVVARDIDAAHWSEKGNAIVASVLAERLGPLVRQSP